MGVATNGSRLRGRARPSMGRSARSSFLGNSMLKGAVIAAMLLSGAHAAAQSAPTADVSAPAAQSTNAFAEQAARLGVGRCANLFSTAGQMMTAGSTYAVQVQASGENPDAHAVQGVAGIAYDTPELKGQAAGVVLAAPVGQACEGQLVRVAPFQKPCADVLALLPGGSTAAGDLSGVPLYDLGGNQGQAMLITNGNSCVVVTVARMASAR